MSIFIKDFNMEVEIFKLKNRYSGNLFKYGLIGEERVAHQLKICDADILCLYDVILHTKGQKSQFDFIIIGRKYIYILEVKNLLGNIRVKSDGTIERLIYKNGNIEINGMFNPFVQLSVQRKRLEEFLSQYQYKKAIKTLLVMANDKTIIINNDSSNIVIKYDELNNYLINDLGDLKSLRCDREIAEIILKNTDKYNYLLSSVIQNKMMNQYIPKFVLKTDENYYIELIKLRKKISKRLNIPACNVYNNKEAEALVINKPTNKEEFMNVKGFKEKRYEMFGDDVIKIFKNH